MQEGTYVFFTAWDI